MIMIGQQPWCFWMVFLNAYLIMTDNSRRPDAHQPIGIRTPTKMPMDGDCESAHLTLRLEASTGLSLQTFFQMLPGQCSDFNVKTSGVGKYWSDPDTTFVSFVGHGRPRLHSNWPKRVIESGAFLAQILSVVGSWVQPGSERSVIAHELHWVYFHSQVL